MKVYRFRVLLQYEDEDIFRDIDIYPSHNLQDLHNNIQVAFEFDNSQMASFYLSNDEWEKGEEMTLFDMNEEGGAQNIKMMQEMVLEETLAGEGDKLLYLFDFMNIWTFYVEMVQILDASKDVTYPAIINVAGKAPEQYGNVANLEDEEAVLLSAQRGSDQESDEIPFQDDIFEGFDDFN